ncbi:MAG: TetR/AcrR family transcriptional regulator [Solirubrobacteraceae bacterium]
MAVGDHPPEPEPSVELGSVAPDGQLSAPEDEALSGEAGRGRAARLVAEEFGEEWAQRILGVWQLLDDWDRGQHLNEGLRERKKRETRQRMSDVATAMFLARGFDNVKVSEIAERVGVSEKTIYNYFPTKESLVYDRAEEQLLSLAAAVRDRTPGSSPMSAFLQALKADFGLFHRLMGDSGPTDGRLAFLTHFAEMIHKTPSLRAAWGEHRDQMVEALTAILADEAGVDPRDPEPLSAARALASLQELLYDSQMRQIADGIGADQLQARVEADLDRAARLLDTGLWSFYLTVEGRRSKDQLRDAGIAAEQARQQVMGALREAKRAWRQLREDARKTGAEGGEAECRPLDELRAKLAEHHREGREARRRMRGRGQG